MSQPHSGGKCDTSQKCDTDSLFCLDEIRKQRAKAIRQQAVINELEKSVTIRVTKRTKIRLQQMGKTPQKGIEHLFRIHDQVKQSPEDLVMKRLEEFMGMLETYYPKEVSDRFSCLPAFIRVGLKRGFDTKILGLAEGNGGTMPPKEAIESIKKKFKEADDKARPGVYP
jgi:hypothetical protein